MSCGDFLYQSAFTSPLSNSVRSKDPRPHPILRRREQNVRKMLNDENYLKKIRASALAKADKYGLTDFTFTLSMVSREVEKAITKVESAGLIRNAERGPNGVLRPRSIYKETLDYDEIAHQAEEQLVHIARKTIVERKIYRMSVDVEHVMRKNPDVIKKIRRDVLSEKANTSRGMMHGIDGFIPGQRYN